MAYVTVMNKGVPVRVLEGSPIHQAILAQNPQQQPQPMSSSSSAMPISSSSGAQPAPLPQSPGVMPPEKSSSTAPVQQQQPQQTFTLPARNVQQPPVQQTAPQPQEDVPFSYTPPAVKDAPIDGTADDIAKQKQKISQVGVNMASPNSVAKPVSPDRWQTVYNWLMGRKPTATPAMDFYIHGLPGLGAVSEEESRQRAEMERKLVQDQLRRKQTVEDGRLAMAQVRERGQDLDQYNKLISQWEKGEWAGDPELEDEFLSRVSEMRDALVQKWNLDPRTLRLPSVNAGGFTQGMNKEVAEPLDKVRHLDEWMGRIYDHAMTDPNWLNSEDANTEFDKLGEFAILARAQSKGAIADAEKIRIQVEMMNPAVRRAYDNVFSMFFADNRGVMAMAQKHKLSESAKKTIMDLGNLLSNPPPDPKSSESYTWRNEVANKLTDKNELGKLATALALAADEWRAPGQNFPPELSAAASAAKQGIEQFQQYVMQDAPVNMGLIWNIASSVRKEEYDKFNDWAVRAGKRHGWKYHTRFTPTEDFGNWIGNWQNRYGNRNAIIGVPVTAGGEPARLAYLGSLAKAWNGANTN